jgi:recombination protein RecA
MARKEKIQKEERKETLGDSKRRALDAAISVIEKQFGTGSIMKMGETKHLDVSSIPTGSISLDLALGIGGVPRGRIIEIFGPEASGKTSLALSIVAQAQKQGGLCAFVDAEHSSFVISATLKAPGCCPNWICIDYLIIFVRLNGYCPAKCV